MFTVCTHCSTRFRLSAAALTAAQGQVRCGKCHEVFDAYENLEGADLPPQMPEPTPVETEPMPEEAASVADIALSITEDDSAPELDAPIEAEAEPITSAPELKARRRRPTEDLPIDDLFATLPDEQEPMPEAEPSMAETDVVQPLGDMEGISAEPAPISYAHVDELHPLPAAPAPQTRHPVRSFVVWSGSLLLLLALGAQLTDMDRAALSQNPVIGPSLQALYASLGRPISKPLAVSDWEVGALNVTTDPDSSGALSITGTLANQAGFVQPWPALRVVLTDRFGEPLRARDFKPADYLPAGQSASLIAPGITARFRVDVVDPGPDAVGFSLTPCLDAPAGRVCAAPNTTD